jgi:uracil-DNA glycosylase family 4
MDKVSLLGNLYYKIHLCRECPDVKESRTARIVDPRFIESIIVFMAQAPGRRGVRISGKHWVDENDNITKGGEFLEKYLNIIGYSVDKRNISLPRPYTTNALHCWTGPAKSGHRAPHKAELENCMKWWEKELDIIMPNILVLLGEQPVIAVSKYLKKHFNMKELKYSECIHNQDQTIKFNNKYIKLFCLPHPSIRPANLYFKIKEEKYNEVFNIIRKLI